MHHCTRLSLLVAVFALLGAGRVVAQEKTAAPAAVTPAAIAKGDSIFHKDGLVLRLPRHQRRGRRWGPI